MSAATRKVPSRAAWAFRMAAACVRRSPSALGDLFRRMTARQGPQKAITTVAHKIARLTYSLLKSGKAYVSGQIEEDERSLYWRQVKRTITFANKLGVEVVIPPDEKIDEMIKARTCKGTEGRGKTDAATPAALPNPRADTAPAVRAKKRGRPRKLQPTPA